MLIKLDEKKRVGNVQEEELSSQNHSHTHSGVVAVISNLSCFSAIATTKERTVAQQIPIYVRDLLSSSFLFILSQGSNRVLKACQDHSF